MSTIKWYKRDPVAYLHGTRKLSLEERGAYADVIELIMSHDGRLEDDDEDIAGWLRCHLRKWRGIKARLVSMGKLHVRDGFLHNNRCDKEASEARNLIETCSKAGKKSGEIRAAKAIKTEACEEQSLPETKAETFEQPTTTTTTTTTTTKEEEESRTPSAREPDARVSDVAEEILADAAACFADKKDVAIAQGKVEADEHAPPKPKSQRDLATQEEMRAQIRSKHSISKPKSTTSMTLAEYRDMYGEDSLPAGMRKNASFLASKNGTATPLAPSRANLFGTHPIVCSPQ